ncbi:MAG: flagellar biosynthesis anti-sigma factor FlgM [Syntrophomonadaceae bacterium]|nr:flagellar biosynthesis anti-sigma factor FlgM [Syntrophomonadaceae bacterium]
MIISANQVQNVLKIYGKQVKSDNIQPRQDVMAPFNKSDEVAISGESKIKQKAVQVAKEAPEVREDKVKLLKEAITTGTYSVSDAQVAEQLIYRLLVDKLV